MVYLSDKDKNTTNFVYWPPGGDKYKAQDATLDVKFAQNTRILDDWYLFGGTKWSRAVFRLRHPVIYSKRGLRNLYRRIKRMIFGNSPMTLCCKWIKPQSEESSNSEKRKK